MIRTIEMPILHREIAEFLDPRIIDMAVAERSAYWEKRPSKLALETVPEKEK